jgi:glyoxylase-like metal-dependent hydrolase (beta-lactamase superfamily II)
MPEMKRSLGRLSRLPDDTVVHPGHDETTTIKTEKERGTFD